MSYFPNRLTAISSLGPDLVSTGGKLITNDWYNIQSYGALGDGSGKTVAQTFGAGITSLALLAAVTDPQGKGLIYSWVSTTIYALTDGTVAAMTMDYLGHQAAVFAAKSAGGGVVYAPQGNYVLNHTVIYPENSVGGNTSGTSTSVSLYGAGVFNTVFRAASDFGSGKFLISCGDPLANKTNLVGRYAFNYYEGVFMDFQVQGPSVTISALGVAPCAMSGIAWGARRKGVRVWAQFLYAGHDIVGDHNMYQDLHGYYCYYGAYMNDASPYLYGDLAFSHCMFTNSRMAGIGVSKNATLSAQFISGYLGYNPYGILGETGSGDSYGQPFAGTYAPVTSQCMLAHMNCEWLGNAFIQDDNATVSGGGAIAARSIARSTIR